MKKMKIKRFLMTIAVLTLCFSACKTTPEEQSPVKEREIVYAIDGNESHETLTTEAEWDAILDKFCDHAYEGQVVIFYNMNQQTYFQPKSAASPKEVTTITTTDREEMKAWMKEMEKQGKTVSISYDKDKGTWNGTAYLNAPHNEDTGDCFTGTLIYYNMPLNGSQIPVRITALQVNSDTTLLIVRDGMLFSDPSSIEEQYQVGDTISLCGTFTSVSEMDISGLYVLDITANGMASIIGNWHFLCLSITEVNGNDMILNTEIYVPEFDETSIYYRFNEDGSATKTLYSPQGTNTESSTWSVNEEGDICCDLFEAGGGCWNINWISSNTMIISKTIYDKEKGNLLYQMQFDTDIALKNLKVAR